MTVGHCDRVNCTVRKDVLHFVFPDGSPVSVSLDAVNRSRTLSDNVAASDGEFTLLAPEHYIRNWLKVADRGAEREPHEFSDTDDDSLVEMLGVRQSTFH
jgi:hypothetical protein